MPVIDRDLVRAINTGRCFALVGCGPSCELGVSSWESLAELVVEELVAPLSKDVADKCRGLLSQKNYPRIFSEAEKVVGLEILLAEVDKVLVKSKDQGSAYQYIAEWPFTCYLTTNFDNYLLEHLEGIGSAYVVRRNSRKDMLTLRAESKNLILKIHGDVTVPNDIVLTESQYLDFQKGADRKYWREKISSVLHMVNLVIFGYSASDPDFKDQLERAKKVASPRHPVFMFATDLYLNKIKEYYQKFNIRVISYNNTDGSHQELHRLLKRYKPFIASRGSASLYLDPVDESVATLASSIHLFTQLRISDTDDACIRKAYESLIMQILSEVPHQEGMSLDELRKSLASKTFASSNVDPAAMQNAIDCLYAAGLVRMSSNMTSVVLKTKGRNALDTIRAKRDLNRQQFKKSCRLFLKREYPEMTDPSAESVIDTMSVGLVKSFEHRGMEIAKSVLSDDIIDVSDATDILEVINMAGSTISPASLRPAFADLMLEVMLSPDEVMKEYLAMLSQGYFAYHALGLEPRCSQERLSIAKERKWILDSSIILPILTIDCQNHLYAKDLLEKMKNLGLHCCTTERLFDEVQEHAWWAINNFEHTQPYAQDFLQAAMAVPPYKQNLFVDGYVKWSFSQGAPTFQRYLTECLGSDYKTDLAGCIRSKIEELEIEVLDFTEWEGFSQESWVDRDAIAAQIEELRKKYGTYRGEAQCTAEAEVILFSEKKKAAFMSPSTILDRLDSMKSRLTWKPEAMYRFLSLFSSIPTDTNLLYSCMIQGFYYSGFDIVDKRVISRYVGPVVRQARMDLDQEKERYEGALGKKEFAELRNEFERTPDEQKPFYSLQFAFQVAVRETKKREAAEARARRAEETKRISDKERQELFRLQQEKAEKRRKAEKQRRRFSSQRGKKGKKRRKQKR